MTDDLGRKALDACRPALWGTIAQSCVLNVLALSGSIYMMLVYDMVIPSRNGASLTGLFVILIVALLFQSAFENLRSSTTRRAARRLGSILSPATAEASRQAALKGAKTEDPVRDLDAVVAFGSGPGPAAFLDMPWTILFVVVLFLLHPMLGMTTLVGAIVLGGLAWWSERSLEKPAKLSEEARRARSSALEERRRSAGTLRSLGMDSRYDARIDAVSAKGVDADHRLQVVSARLTGASRTARMLLQSLVLTVGAMLVIDGRASGGIIFASSILSGRALAPVDGAIAQWRGLSAARRAWTRLTAALAAAPSRSAALLLPRPEKSLSVEALSSGPPGSEAFVTDMTFRLYAGQAVGIVGPSASGKSTLLRAIAGQWPILAGAVRIDGATLDQWDPDELGRHVGWLAQDVDLIDGTVADNIGRLDPEATPEAIVSAARKAGCHDMILRLPQGYATRVGEAGRTLSGGQRQRIGLARALYGDPFLVILDEPNSNLDPEGEHALSQAIASIRARGGACIVAAHRASALASCDLAMIVADGRMKAFGPRDSVLRPGKPTQGPSSGQQDLVASRSVPA
jgi:PrtD family type I secretion system ABC transporter